MEGLKRKTIVIECFMGQMLLNVVSPMREYHLECPSNTLAVIVTVTVTLTVTVKVTIVYLFVCNSIGNMLPTTCNQ